MEPHVNGRLAQGVPWISERLEFEYAVNPDKHGAWPSDHPLPFFTYYGGCGL